MEIIKLEEEIEYKERFNAKNLADVPEAQINLVCVLPHQDLPAHETNSNVRLLVISGRITVEAGEETGSLNVHEMVAIPYKTHMQIRNTSDANAAFLVIKTPNPSQMI